MKDENEIVFSYGKTETDDICLEVGNKDFCFGIWFDTQGDAGWYVVSSDGVTPQAWGSIKKDCIEEIKKIMEYKNDTIRDV